jgi:hypothetical protein
VGKARGEKNKVAAPSARVATHSFKVTSGRDNHPGSPGASHTAEADSREGSTISPGASGSDDFAAISVKRAMLAIQ